MKVKRVLRSVGTVLAAVAVGAGAGLLLAPHSGRQSRRLIKRKTEDLGEGVRQIYGNLVEKGDGAARRLRYRLKLRLPVRRMTERPAG